MWKWFCSICDRYDYIDTAIIFDPLKTALNVRKCQVEPKNDLRRIRNWVYNCSLLSNCIANFTLSVVSICVHNFQVANIGCSARDHNLPYSMADYPWTDKITCHQLNQSLQNKDICERDRKQDSMPRWIDSSCLSSCLRRQEFAKI